MSDDSPNEHADDELERRVAALESESWVGTLRGLKPAQGLDLYAVGFEAGKRSAVAAIQSAPKTATSIWSHTRTALWSSVVSVAATLLLLITVPEGDSRQRIESAPIEAAAGIETHAISKEFAPKNSAESASQTGISNFDDVFAEMPSIWRDRLQQVEPQVLSGDDSNYVVDVKPSHLRYAFQRRQLIENLRETIQ